MVFRLPTHLESFLPPPSQQVPQSMPWRGTLLVNVRSNEINTHRELRVTAVETEGDSRVDLWPSHLYVYPTYDRPILNDVQAWVTRHTPPTCTFIPDRLRDPNETTVNQNAFRSFSHMLFENQMVAVAPWNAPDRLPGGGVIFYPAQNSTALLVGVIFLSSPFPPFVAASLSQIPTSASTSSRQPIYPQQPMMGAPNVYAGVHANNPSSSYRLPNPIPGQLDPYRYMMSRQIQDPFAAQMPSSSDEDGLDALAAAQQADEDQGSRFLM